MDEVLQLTQRELSEIHLAMVYAQDFHHGTAGHNSYMVLAKIAALCGFQLSTDGKYILYPGNIEVAEETKRE